MLKAYDGRDAQVALVEEALRKHEAALRVFLQTRVTGGEVDDVFQIASIRALEHAGSLRDSARVRSWLYRTFRNVVIDEARKRSANRRALSKEAATPRVVHPSPALCRCSLAQAKELRPSYATILSLVDLGESTLSEAASSLGLTLGNATVRLHRARKALRKRMWEHCGVRSYAECVDCRCADDGCCDA